MVTEQERDDIFLDLVETVRRMADDIKAIRETVEDIKREMPEK